MRPLYLFLRFTLPYAFSIYFKRTKILNSQKKFYAQTIFVSNHPSAFFDPLVIANFQIPIVHFMTRSDVFKWWLKPVTWACHMVPIYRAEQDGAGTYDKNQNVFKAIQRVLKKKHCLILFGEGYTDDVFIRSLKPMKKGAPRIGFSTMVNTNWELDIKVQPIGVNYANPNVFRSDCLMSCGEIIHLKDYKEIYDENPNKAITQLMKDIGKGIQENITYIQDKSKSDFHEHLMMLTRKGMNHDHFDNKYSLEDRFNYSRSLANRMNQEYSEEATDWSELEEIVEAYFKELKIKKVEDKHVHEFSKKGNKKKLALRWLQLFIVFPVFLVGLIHNVIPYLITKKLVEKMFRRKVFWGGVKMVLGGLVWLLCCLPIIWLFQAYIYPSTALAWAYFFSVPATTFIIAYWWKKLFSDTIKFNNHSNDDLLLLSKKRTEVMQKVQDMKI
jgi:glycerol-3-phosphate O-acyltransferase/dihydroxyacetone phosphate acyltransferase